MRMTQTQTLMNPMTVRLLSIRIIMIIITGECFRSPRRGTHGNPEHPPLLRRGNLSEWGGKVIRMVEAMVEEMMVEVVMVGDGE